MIEEIGVGDYVRTKSGYIAKLIEISDKGYCWFDNWICKESGIPHQGIRIEDYKNIIVKHSKNLVDLIEVKDIVFIEDLAELSCLYIYSKEMLQALNEEVRHGAKITSVLTHEQFKQNCYEVEGEE